MLNENKKILFIDIEATNLDADMGQVLCIGYKFANEKDVHVIHIAQYSNFKKDTTNDRELLKAFEKTYEKADIIVHHYGERFDVPYLNTRRLINKMLPMPTVASIDTWKIAKYKMKLHSNRLASLIEALECPIKKTPIEGKHWRRASAGYEDSLKYVVEHCKYDILSLEWVYNKIKGLMTNHPLITELYKPGDACPVCGKNKGMYKNGTRITQLRTYQRLYCKNCGHTVKGEIIKR